MNHSKVLNLTGDWEDIVNNVDRHNKRCRRDQAKRESELHKMLNKAFVLCYGRCTGAGPEYCRAAYHLGSCGSCAALPLCCLLHRWQVL